MPNIHCPSCKTHLQSVLATYKLQKLDIDVSSHCISYEGSWDSRHIVERALAAVGYHVEPDPTRIKPSHRELFTDLARRFLARRRDRQQRQEHIKHCIKCQIELGLAIPSSETPLEGIVVLPSSQTPGLRETVFGVEGMTCT